jgi:hypothetical protein
LAPFGDHPNSGGIQHVTEEGCRSLANSFNSIWNSLPRGGAPIYVGHPDHPAFAQRDRDTRALGWIKSLDVRDGGLWANAKWNTRGRTIVNEEELIYPSVNWEVRRRDGVPTRLQSVGLTNSPNIQGLPPISNINEKLVMNKELLKLLGLPEAATEADVLNATGELKTNLVNALAQAKADADKITVLSTDKNVFAGQVTTLTNEKAGQAETIKTLTAEKETAATAKATAETALANEKQARAADKCASLITAGKITKAQEKDVTAELANDYPAAAAKYDAIKPVLHTESVTEGLGTRSNTMRVNTRAIQDLVNEEMKNDRYASYEQGRRYTLAFTAVQSAHPELFTAATK